MPCASRHQGGEPLPRSSITFPWPRPTGLGTQRQRNDQLRNRSSSEGEEAEDQGHQARREGDFFEVRRCRMTAVCSARCDPGSMD